MNLTKEITKLEKSRVKLDVTIPKTELKKPIRNCSRNTRNVQISASARERLRKHS